MSPAVLPRDVLPLAILSLSKWTYVGSLSLDMCLYRRFVPEMLDFCKTEEMNYGQLVGARKGTRSY